MKTITSLTILFSLIGFPILFINLVFIIYAKIRNLNQKKISWIFISTFIVIFGVWLILFGYTFYGVPPPLISYSKRELYVTGLYGLICIIAGFSNVFSGVSLLFKKISWSLHMALVPILILTIPTVVLSVTVPINFYYWTTLYANCYIIDPILILISIVIIKTQNFASY